MSKEEILELINAGFAPELIELEFNVPIEKINKYIKQEEKRKADEELKKAAQVKQQEKIELAKQKADRKKTETPKAHTPPKTTNRYTQNTLDILRKNYNKLITMPLSNFSTTSIPEPSEEEKEKVNQAIAKIKKIYEPISKKKVTSRIDKRTILENMLSTLNGINTTPKTLEQLEELRKIFQPSELENLTTSHSDKINLRLSKARKNIAETLAELIEQKANQTTDLDELAQLSKRLPIYTNGKESIFISSIKTKIVSKLSQLRTAQTIHKMHTQVSPEIETILYSISDSSFNLEAAREAISTEAQRRVDTAPKTQFALSKERQQKQVEIQIRTLISDQGNKYPITNPELALNNLMLLFDEKDKENSFSKIVENLASQKKYDEAKELCNKYTVKRSYDEDEPSISKRARQLHKNIILTQIGNMVAEQIQKPSNLEEDTMFMTLLEERMQKERVSPQQIIIGITPGGRKLTLNEIWYTHTRMQK